MNILRRPLRSIQTRRIDKVGQTQNILLEQDDSGDRIAEAINVYARGVNPSVSVSYDNFSNNAGALSARIQGIGQATLPYKIQNFRPPVFRQEDLLPLSRLPRVWNHATTNPAFPNFVHDRQCSTIKKTLIEEDKMLRSEIPEHRIDNSRPTITDDAIRSIPTHGIAPPKMPTEIESNRSDRYQPTLADAIILRDTPRKCLQEQVTTISADAPPSYYEQNALAENADLAPRPEIQRNRQIYEAFSFLTGDYQRLTQSPGWSDLRKTVKENMLIMQAREASTTFPQLGDDHSRAQSAEALERVMEKETRTGAINPSYSSVEAVSVRTSPIHQMTALADSKLSPSSLVTNPLRTSVISRPKDPTPIRHETVLSSHALRSHVDIVPVQTRSYNTELTGSGSIAMDREQAERRPSGGATLEEPLRVNLSVQPSSTHTIEGQTDLELAGTPSFGTKREAFTTTALTQRTWLQGQRADHAFTDAFVTPTERNVPVHETFVNPSLGEQEFQGTMVLPRERRVLQPSVCENNPSLSGLSSGSWTPNREVDHLMRGKCMPTSGLDDTRGNVARLPSDRDVRVSPQGNRGATVDDWTDTKHRASQAMLERFTA